MRAVAGPRRGVERATRTARYGLLNRVFGRVFRNPCGSNSFEGATLVLMCDGTQSPIEELEEGDWVWARDVLTGVESCEQVTETFVHEDDQLLALTLRSELSGEYERLVVTHDHPMLSPAGEEIAAYALKLDQRLGGLYDDFVVVALEPLELVLPVHNLSVANAHTFFVGDAAVWAHNCIIFGSSTGKKMAKHLPDYGKNAKNKSDRMWYKSRAEEVVKDADARRVGAWHPQDGGGSDYKMYKKNNDLVVLDSENNFVTMFPDTRAGGNGWWNRAENVE